MIQPFNSPFPRQPLKPVQSVSRIDAARRTAIGALPIASQHGIVRPVLR